MTDMRYKRTAKKRGRPGKKDIYELNNELLRQQEHQMRESRRMAVVKGGDPTLSSYPLGLLMARGCIEQGEHDAGLRYACLFGRVFGKTVPSVPGDMHKEISEEAMETCERRWREASEMLMAQSRSIKDEVENAAIYHRFVPLDEWTPKTRRRIARLKIGLQVLDRWIRG